MENINIKCQDCEEEFVFTVREQKFYQDKGYANPIRCKKCRALKKEREAEKQRLENEFKEIYEKIKKNTIKIKK